MTGTGKQTQPRKGYFLLINLLNQTAVQEELKLCKDQIKQIQEYSTQLKEFPRLSEEERERILAARSEQDGSFLTETLQPAQFKRVRQISLQVGAPRAFQVDEVTTALEISPEQQEQIQRIGESSHGQMMDIAMSNSAPEEKRAKFAKMRRSNQESLLLLLTDNQRTKLEVMQGEPFTGELGLGF